MSVNQGVSQAFTVTANPGYYVASVLVDGSSVGGVTSYTFTNVTANHTIAATFAINTYTITSSAGANGTISPSGAVPVNHGSSQAFAITPAAGYRVAGVLVGLGPGGNGNYAIFGYTSSGYAFNRWLNVGIVGWPAVGDTDGDGMAEILCSTTIP